MEIIQKIAHDLIFNILELSAQLSVLLGWFVPALIGLIIYMFILSNKQIRFLLTILVLMPFVSSPLVTFLPYKYYMFWSLNRGYLVSYNEALYFVIILVLSMLFTWVLHQRMDNFIEWISPRFLSESKIKSKNKTDIENMQKGEDYMPFDPLDIEKKGFVALGKNYE
tara:strand:+ start:2594 stop:3094 length:501 start_codon:yes stop_codon:yes gene_type:complete